MSKEQYYKWYFYISGLITTLGALPSMLSPIKGTLLTMGFDISNYQFIYPLVGHWGTMVVGIGILIFLCANNIILRKYIIWYSIIEKTYLVLSSSFLYYISPEIGQYYFLAIILDSLQVLGGLIFVFTKNER